MSRRPKNKKKEVIPMDAILNQGPKLKQLQ